MPSPPPGTARRPPRPHLATSWPDSGVRCQGYLGRPERPLGCLRTSLRGWADQRGRHQEYSDRLSQLGYHFLRLYILKTRIGNLDLSAWVSMIVCVAQGNETSQNNFVQLIFLELQGQMSNSETERQSSWGRAGHFATQLPPRVRCLGAVEAKCPATT
jgi:hypothetical protein